jgi:ankyrin repeat protein
MAQFLLSHGADVNSEDDGRWTPLPLTAYRGLYDIARLLLGNGAMVDTRIHDSQQTPFHWAAFLENGPLVDLFINYGANVNSKNCDGETALCNDARYSYKMAKQLLESGADPNIQTNRGETPLH